MPLLPSLTQTFLPLHSSCVPFTPVTGQRILVQEGPLKSAIVETMASAMVQITGECVKALQRCAQQCAQDLVCETSPHKHKQRCTLSAPLDVVRSCVRSIHDWASWCQIVLGKCRDCRLTHLNAAFCSCVYRKTEAAH